MLLPLIIILTNAPINSSVRTVCQQKGLGTVTTMEKKTHWLNTDILKSSDWLNFPGAKLRPSGARGKFTQTWQSLPLSKKKLISHNSLSLMWPWTQRARDAAPSHFQALFLLSKHSDCYTAPVPASLLSRENLALWALDWMLPPEPVKSSAAGRPVIRVGLLQIRPLTLVSLYFSVACDWCFGRRRPAASLSDVVRQKQLSNKSKLKVGFQNVL